MGLGIIAGILMVVVGSIMLLFGPIIFQSVYTSVMPILSTANSSQLNTTIAGIQTNFFNTVSLLGTAILLIGAMVIIGTVGSFGAGVGAV